MSRHTLGRTLADQLHSAERSLDGTIADFSHLLLAMTSGRIQNRISLTVGQPAIDSVTATLALLASSRQKTIELHEGLKQAADLMGVDYTLSGPGDDKPKKPPLGALAAAPDESPRLRLV